MTINLTLTHDDAVRLLLALEFAIKDLKNMVATCPDHLVYAKELTEYAAEINLQRTLHHSIHAAIQAESQKCKLILPN